MEPRSSFASRFMLFRFFSWSMIQSRVNASHSKILDPKFFSSCGMCSSNSRTLFDYFQNYINQPSSRIKRAFCLMDLRCPLSLPLFDTHARALSLSLSLSLSLHFICLSDSLSSLSLILFFFPIVSQSLIISLGLYQYAGLSLCRTGRYWRIEGGSSKRQGPLQKRALEESSRYLTT